MCGLIWLPRPRTNRPFEYACRSQAVFAKVIGDHGGIVEFETGEQGTEFRLRLPMHTEPDEWNEDAELQQNTGLAQATEGPGA